MNIFWYMIINPTLRWSFNTFRTNFELRMISPYHAGMAVYTSCCEEYLHLERNIFLCYRHQHQVQKWMMQMFEIHSFHHWKMTNFVIQMCYIFDLLHQISTLVLYQRILSLLCLVLIPIGRKRIDPHRSYLRYCCITFPLSHILFLGQLFQIQLIQSNVVLLPLGAIALK